MTETAGRGSFETCRDHLDALASRLEGFDREISLSHAGSPILVVTNPDEPVLSDHVLCCHDEDGVLIYLWPWGKRIADVHHVIDAAYAVANMLSAQKPERPARHR